MFATGYLPLIKRLPDLMALPCKLPVPLMDSPNLLQKPGVCFRMLAFRTHQPNAKPLRDTCGMQHSAAIRGTATILLDEAVL